MLSAANDNLALFSKLSKRLSKTIGFGTNWTKMFSYIRNNKRIKHFKWGFELKQNTYSE